MTKIKPEDHPDFIGGWKWTKLELDWINERICTLESALFQAQEAAKDLASQLAKKETLLNEAMWSYGELKREQLANQAKTLSSPIAADTQIAAHAKRLALELECLLLSCEETYATSKWWASAHQALGEYQDDVERLYPQDHVSPLGKD